VISDDSDVSWEQIGRENPYFGVLTDPRFRGRALEGDLKTAFLKTGEDHVKWLTASIARHFGGLARTETAIDFGCGVGRLAIPLASMFKQVVGVDVSRSMLAEAKKNALERGSHNIQFVRSDDHLGGVEGSFDLVHSVITFQHIPTERGEVILSHLLERLHVGGVIAIQFYAFRPVSKARRWFTRLRGLFRPLHWGINVANRRRWNEPLMQHNIYDMGHVLQLFTEAGVRDVYLEIGPAGSVFLFAKKPLGKSE
jgi:SAM-dependent methyltransferase